MPEPPNARDVLLTELRDFPEPFLDEVVDFVRFLKGKANRDRVEPALLSESVLRRDWLRPEEDDAWREL
jgi:hypothetical protein